MRTKYRDVCSDEDLKKADIISFNETKLHKDEVISLTTLDLTRHYEIFQYGRHRKGARLIIVVDKKFNLSKLELYNSKILVVTIKLHFPDPFNFISVYRPQQSNVSIFISNVSAVLKDCCYVPTYVPGDFNKDLSSVIINQFLFCITMHDMSNMLSYQT